MKNKMGFKFHMDAKGNIKGEAYNGANSFVTREECDRFLDHLEDELQIFRQSCRELYEKRRLKNEF